MTNQINDFNKSLIEIKYKNQIIDQKIEAFYSYLYNFKNDSSIYQLIKPKGIKGKKKIRVGSKKDGGYVLLDDFDKIKIAYSFGIGGEISFDKALADKNIDVFMYDHTIRKLPFKNPKFHWRKIGLTSKKGKEDNMKTLIELLQENGHINEKNMILKMDIEGCEWEILKDIKSDILKQFRFIVAEFHFQSKSFSFYSKAFKKLNLTHQIFHIHCNNYWPIINIDGNNICSLLEISFAIKENNTFIKSEDYFPVSNIDYPNHKNLIDFDEILNIFQIDNIFPIL